MIIRDLCPPFYITPMPVNINGHGPEMDELKVVKTYYQVWDCIFQDVDEFETIEEANNLINELNKFYEC